MSWFIYCWPHIVLGSVSKAECEAKWGEKRFTKLTKRAWTMDGKACCIRATVEYINKQTNKHESTYANKPCFPKHRKEQRKKSVGRKPTPLAFATDTWYYIKHTLVRTHPHLGLASFSPSCIDYGCALQKEILVQGRLYISENHVCFNANIFGWVTNVSCLVHIYF